MKKLYLVDVSSLFFRAFYAIRPLTSPAGVPTNAIYGFLSMVTKVLKDEKPDYIVFCYDRKEPSFRKEIYHEYKANRSETPEDLVPQIPYIKKFADLLGIPSVEVPGFEADDLIGTLTKIGRRHGLEVFIVSGDKDFAQLIEPHVWIFDTMKNLKLDNAGVKEKWGVRPEQMIDYLALVGDSSDNIPGVRGIGPKGALKLLDEYHTLDEIYKNVDKVTGSLHEKLMTGKEMAYLSKRLVTIVTDAPVENELEVYHIKPYHKEELQKLVLELGFRNLEKTIELLPLVANNGVGVGPQAAKSTTGDAGEDKSEATGVKEVAEVKEAGVLSHPPHPLAEASESKDSASEKYEMIDVESSTIPEHFKKAQDAWIFLTQMGLHLAEVSHGPGSSHGHLAKQKIYTLHGALSDFSGVLSKLELQYLGFDLKTIWHQLKIENPKCKWDSMLAAYVVKPGESMDFDRVYSRFTGELPSDLPSPQQVFSQHLRLHEVLIDRVKTVHGVEILNKIDFPLAPILYRMEKIGICLDREMLAKQSRELGQDISVLEKEIFELCGETFNIASPKQLGHVLFDKLKLSTSKKTKTGFSTDTDVLEKLKEEHPVAELLLIYRELTKLKSTYVDSLPHLIKEDGRIHTTFNQALTTTGRLSSIDPNLQNIPIRTERGTRVRKAFVAAEGKVFLSADYSQIELRILAHYSSDENLIKAFHQEIDVHSATASEIFAVSLAEVSPEMRRAAKAVNFGIAYGQGAFGLAENLRVSRTEAADIIKKYFAKFPGVSTYIEQTIEKSKDQGYIETLYGRRRYLDDLKSSAPQIRKFAERAAINAPIQGTASDIVKMAMLEIDQKIDIPMILQVHDELIFEGSEKELIAAQDQIVKIMESVCQLKVPLKVNAFIGPNWDEAH